MGRSPRVGWLALAVLPGLCLELGSCTDDSPAASSPEADAAPPQRDAPGEPAEDAQPDVKKPPPIIPACVGTSLPVIQSGERTYVTVDMTPPGDGGAVADGGDGGDAGGDAGGTQGDFLLDFGANGSTIDIDAFRGPLPTPSICYGDGDAGNLGTLCEFTSFDFFGAWGTVSLVTADYSFLINSVKQAGIIGTDFLSVYPFTLDYANARVWKGSPTSFCTDAQLLGAGYAPLPAGGFYTNKFSNLRPLSEVITDPDASTAGFVVPNIPTVPIGIAGVTALAQIDTGYDDRIIRHSINVNQAFLDRLLQQAPNLLQRRAVKDLFLTTCVPGLSQKGLAYFLAPGTPVDFIGEGGTVGRRDVGNVLFVKERLPAAERCGGIETWTVPAAQLGASFLTDAQAVVFDPIKSRVWIPKQ